MELAAKDILKVLTQKGIRNLHHANSVKTACSFLKSGKLLSRGNLIDLGLSQTNQYTDALDKEHGLWHDVFVDTVNIHDQARRRNLYGPVLFE